MEEIRKSTITAKEAEKMFQKFIDNNTNRQSPFDHLASLYQNPDNKEKGIVGLIKESMK